MKIIPIVSLIVLAASCGHNKSDNNSNSTASLDGSWISGCVPSEGGSSKQALVFTNNQASFSTTGYADTECSQGQEQIAVRFEAAIVQGSPARSPSDATNIDFISPKTFYTPKTTETTSLFNAASFFGMTTWVKDGEVEVTGKTASGGIETQTVVYSIFKVTGNTICLGEDSGENDGSSEDKRLNKLNTGSACLTKQ